MSVAAPHPLCYFDRVFIVNLPSRSDRRREMEQQLRSIGLSLTAPPIELFSGIRPAERGDFPSIGARGCFLSHLSILKRAAAAGYQRIAIFEDDLNFAPDFNARLRDAIELLESDRWHIFYGGYYLPGDPVLAPGLPCIRPEQPLRLAHFLAMCAPTMSLAAKLLETFLTRAAGDPQGGPMHVDGAYSWLRRLNPDLVTRVAVPQLGQQRASRTDIHSLRWFDRFPGVRSVAAAARVLKNATGRK